MTPFTSMRVYKRGQRRDGASLAVDGWKLGSAGYKLWDFMLSRAAGAPEAQRQSDPQSDTWHLKLAIVRKPKPVLMN